MCGAGRSRKIWILYERSTNLTIISLFLVENKVTRKQNKCIMIIECIFRIKGKKKHEDSSVGCRAAF